MVHNDKGNHLVLTALLALVSLNQETTVLYYRVKDSVKYIYRCWNWC